MVIGNLAISNRMNMGLLTMRLIFTNIRRPPMLIEFIVLVFLLSNACSDAHTSLVPNDQHDEAALYPGVSIKTRMW